MIDEMANPLEAFQREIDNRLVFGDLADFELPAVDDHGEHHVVAALAEEQLHMLLTRIDRCDGYANIFVKDGSKVAFLVSIHESCAIGANSAEDLTGESRPSLRSSVGLFVEYLKEKVDGVRLPAHRGDLSSPKLSIDREIEFA